MRTWRTWRILTRISSLPPDAEAASASPTGVRSSHSTRRGAGEMAGRTALKNQKFLYNCAPAEPIATPVIKIITTVSEFIAHFNEITFLYDQYRALDRVDFTLPRTGVVGLLGLNGAGKTTTMNLLCGVLTPNAGQVLIDGRSMKLQPNQCKSLIGYAPDRPPLYPDCTVTEYLSYCAALRQIPKKARADAIARALHSASIADHAHKLCGHLSHGYRQRLNLAQAILHSPQLLVLDEPTSGLDPAQIESVRALILNISRDACVLISTHLLHEAQQLSQRVLIVHGGNVIEDVAAADTTASRVQLRFAAPPATATSEADSHSLVALMGGCEAVAEVRADNAVSLSAELAWPDDPARSRAQLLSFIASKGLDLIEFGVEKNDLEKRFLDMTRVSVPAIEPNADDSHGSSSDGPDSDEADDSDDSDDSDEVDTSTDSQKTPDSSSGTTA
ncbi:MAG: ABC transporter ATP-binding protein [Proteobacteria bacterium]|nr:ABC transporter ATP-binding protein [Pseudomonadota bacterium]